MLSLVSLAHKVSRADASHSELQTRVPGTKRHLSSRTVWGSATHDTAIQDGGRRPCAEMLRSGAREHARAHPARTLPPPLPTDRTSQSSPTHSPSGRTQELRRASSHLSVLRSKDKAFLCLWTESGLLLLVWATQGRRTLFGDRLGKVSNTGALRKSVLCLG